MPLYEYELGWAADVLTRELLALKPGETFVSRPIRSRTRAWSMRPRGPRLRLARSRWSFGSPLHWA